jgi:hypothetical protein
MSNDEIVHVLEMQGVSYYTSNTASSVQFYIDGKIGGARCGVMIDNWPGDSEEPTWVFKRSSINGSLEELLDRFDNAFDLQNFLINELDKYLYE